MTDFDRLPPDQRAVLSLLLERGKSYSEVADMLAIPESAVRERAHAALDALAQTGGRSAERTAPRRQPQARSTPAGSRRAGLMLLGGIVVVIAVVAILIASLGSKGSSPPASSTNASTSTPTSSTATTSADKPKLDKTITLTAGEPELKASGLAYVLSEGNRRAFYVAAQGLPPSSGFFYAVWLYNSPTNSTPLGKAPTVGSNGRMEGGGPLPSNAGSYGKLIITRETSSAPKEPGPIVLTGNFALH